MLHHETLMRTVLRERDLERQRHRVARTAQAIRRSSLARPAGPLDPWRAWGRRLRAGAERRRQARALDLALAAFRRERPTWAESGFDATLLRGAGAEALRAGDADALARAWLAEFAAGSERDLHLLRPVAEALMAHYRRAAEAAGAPLRAPRSPMRTAPRARPRAGQRTSLEPAPLWARMRPSGGRPAHAGSATRHAPCAAPDAAPCPER